MSNSKSLFRSKTFWVNALTAGAGVLATLGGSELIAAHPRVAAFIATALGVVNVALRLVTSQPVELTT